MSVQFLYETVNQLGILNSAAYVVDVVKLLIVAIPQARTKNEMFWLAEAASNHLSSLLTLDSEENVVENYYSKLTDLLQPSFDILSQINECFELYSCIHDLVNSLLRISVNVSELITTQVFCNNFSVFEKSLNNEKHIITLLSMFTDTF
jgi:hypothetical protein